MACPEFENQLGDYLDRQAPPATQRLIEAHLATCIACRALARDLASLDAELAAHLAPPKISADFDARLWRRLAVEPPLVPAAAAARAEHRRRLQAEYETGWTSLRHRTRWWLAGLDGLGWATLLALVLYGLWRFTSHSQAVAGWAIWQVQLTPSLLAAWLAAAAALFAGWRQAARHA
ncbi:MAG: hypothetical protein FJ387_06525 [Verrucomicrobia bacterium]|nr:hypothetical protein [Verrucomicrobiota bacterium]